MFTGIVAKTARVSRITCAAAGAVLVVENAWDAPPRLGESISVNGACLTVVSANGREISFDVSEETFRRTTFGEFRPGGTVNLERALKVGDDVSGHFVAGHVDGTGVVESLSRNAAFAELRVRAPEELAVYLVPKGSVAIDGVSLTVATLEGASFSVAVIPETLTRTTLGKVRTGDRVNIETDMLGKYVVRYLALMPGGKSEGLTAEKLREAGF